MGTPMEEANRAILEYNILALGGRLLRLVRGGEMLAEGPGSLEKTGMELTASELGDGEVYAARAVLPRPAFPLPRPEDRLLDVSTGDEFEVMSLGRFGETSVEAILQYRMNVRIGSSKK